MLYTFPYLFPISAIPVLLVVGCLEKFSYPRAGFIKLFYQTVSSVSGQDESNPAL